MRLRPASSAIRVPPPSPFILMLVVLAFVSCELARSAAHASPPDEQAAQRIPHTRGPNIASVLKAAYRAAGLDRDLGKGWIRRARLAGLIPWLTVRTGRDTSWQSDDVSVDHGMALDVRATWRLDRLAFDGRELQVASIEAARRRERRRLASHVIRVYFVWQRAMTKAEGDAYRGTEAPGSTGDTSSDGESLPTGAATRPSTRSRALEAAAELDALTDGWFSERLGGSRRTASGARTP